MTILKDRIRKILESQHMTQQEFAETIKVAPATLSSIFTGRTAPSLKIVESIKSHFPDISTDWLLFGRGAMTDYSSVETGETFNSPSTADHAVLDFGAVSGNVEDNNVKQTKSNVDASCSNNVSQGSGDVLRNNAGQQHKANNSKFDKGMQLVKNNDISNRDIVEIRIFYSDQTWETFVPKK